MISKLMDGTALARTSYERTAERAQDFLVQAGRQPSLAAVLVGGDPASETYVKMKANRSRKVGIATSTVRLPETTTTAELLATLNELSSDPDIDGILLQHPVPPQIDERGAFEAIDPNKDVDGVTVASFGDMAFGLGGFRSCTPAGIMALLDAYAVELKGAEAVVVGRSPILGKPVGMLLLERDATVTYCHSRTVGLAEHVGRADVVVAAVGKPELIRGAWIKPGAVVVDAGYNPGNLGDVEFSAAAQQARLITPVPGGVGPMTIAVLLEQTVDAAFSSLSDG